jgi:predicted transcriptional regulator
MLYKNGFFKDRVTFSEIVGKLEQLELSFPRSTIMNTLKRLHKEGVLTREGSKRNYMFMQRIRPEDYFK